MFKFDFDVDEDPEVDSALLVGGSSNIESQRNTNRKDEKSSEDVAVAPFVEHSLEELLNTLPSTGFSFSPIHIPSHTPNADPVILPRRDLFDARFQLIASSSQENSEAEESEEKVDSDLKFVEAPSDLIPGVYEGGLKTWECSVDLAAYLHDRIPSESVVGKRVLELGCGTAIPSMYLLRQAFSREPATLNTSQTAIHLQDYNELVFRLAVLPNIILTWYMSPASASFRERLTNTGTNSTETSEDDETYPPADPSQPGDLPITPELFTAFRKSLTEYNIDLRFFSGSWEAFTFDEERRKRKYDLVLTSETIYRINSLPSLLNFMWQASTSGSGGSNSLEDLTSELKISAEDDEPLQVEHKGPGVDGLCIVAAKLVYFGVGGGVSEFVDAVENVRHSGEGALARPAGSVRTVWKKDEGVKRVIMEVKW
ncbi:hypothetical protein BC629DRAFT_893881 [Irpex lacteus]|nr:hypothetical protein BC629DRAFT_893881 [Irpex lacteus]